MNTGFTSSSEASSRNLVKWSLKTSYKSSFQKSMNTLKLIKKKSEAFNLSNEDYSKKKKEKDKMTAENKMEIFLRDFQFIR